MKIWDCKFILIMRFIVVIICLLFAQSSYCAQNWRLFISGCGNRAIAEVNYHNGDILWEHPVVLPEDCNDIEAVGKDILYAYRTGARLIDRNGRVKWDYVVGDKCELYTATRISKNQYMLAICSDSTHIVLLDKNGREQKRIYFDTGVKNIHGQLRQVLYTKDNTFLVPIMRKGELVEIDTDGKILKSIKVGGNPFSVHKSNQEGVYIVSCGDAGKVVFVDLGREKIVKTISTDDIKGDVKMLFVGEVKQLPNGNLLIANWNGHSKDKSQPKLFEIDSDNNLVSTLAHNEKIRNISCFSSIH